MSSRSENWLNEARFVSKVLARAPILDKNLRIERAEFQERQRKVIAALAEAKIDAAIVYSDEHYAGDVPYLAGNTNISIEPVAAVIPGLDYVVVERTLGKDGPEVQVLTKLPENVQHMVGKA